MLYLFLKCAAPSINAAIRKRIWWSLDTLAWYWHDDVTKWKHFPRYWPFVRGIHRSPVNSPHKGQWRGALMFSLICVWINGWVNNGEAGYLRRYRTHYDVTVMQCYYFLSEQHSRIMVIATLIPKSFQWNWVNKANYPLSNYHTISSMKPLYSGCRQLACHI